MRSHSRRIPAIIPGAEIPLQRPDVISHSRIGSLIVASLLTIVLDALEEENTNARFTQRPRFRSEFGVQRELERLEKPHRLAIAN
jgi:hypothetical protein